MRVTVVAELQLQPERKEAFVEVVAEQLRRGREQIHRRIAACLLDVADDPNALIYLGQWESRGAFDAQRKLFPLPDGDEWYAAPTRVAFYAPLVSFREVSTPSEASGLMLVEGAVESEAASRAFLCSYAQSVQPAEIGVVEYEVAGQIDAPEKFLVFVRWRREADRTAEWARSGAKYMARLAELGLTVRRLSGGRRAATSPESP